jgi:K+-transporting ATPase ATPase A chain
MPLSGMMEMLNMQINTWFGGVGVGWMNYFTFIIMAVFISGLMVGRTPEFLGHKVEAREMKIASIVALLHPVHHPGGNGFRSLSLCTCSRICGK